MGVTYGFFNSVNGDRKYTAEDIGRYLLGIVSTGVYADDINNLRVLAGTGMQVEVQPGRGMLEYHFIENDAPLPFTLSASGTMDRIDAIVMRLDRERRLCEIAVKEGTPAVTPTVPTMLRTDNTMEYMLAYVYVPKLSSAITQENITDTRADPKVCGWVTGLVSQAALGLPVPNAGDALKIPQVNEAGDGYELLPTDSTLSFSGAPADAAAVGTALADKAAANHGTHVPTPQTANNAKFLRNDNTWQTVTPANIGAAAANHGTHVPTPQTADNAKFLRNDNTWQTVTPANIGAVASSSAAASSVSNSHFTAHFVKLGSLVVCSLVPYASRDTIMYESSLTIPSGYRPKAQARFTPFSVNSLNSGGSGLGTEVKANTDGALIIGAPYGITINEATGTYCWISA